MTRSLFIGLITCLAIFGCDKTSPTAPLKGTDKTAQGQKAAAKDNAFPAGPTVLREGIEPLKYLPNSTLIVGVTHDLDGLYTHKLVVGKITQLFNPDYDNFIKEVIRETGQNFFIPKTYAEMGIDIKAPFGFFYSDAHKEMGGFWTSLSDPAKFKASLLQFGTKAPTNFEERTKGEATILFFKRDPEVQFLIRGKTAFIIIADNSGTDAIKLADQIATSKGDGLGTNPKLLASMKTVGYGRDASFWFNGKALVDAIIADITRDRQLDWAQRSLVQAHERKADAAQIAQIEARVAETKKSAMKRMVRKQAEAMVARLILSPFGDLGIGLQIEKTAIQIKADFGLKSESHHYRMLKTINGQSRLVGALNKVPLHLSVAAVDPPIILEWTRSFSEAIGEGRDFKQIEDMIQKTMGLNLDALAKMFGGEMGIAVTHDVPLRDLFKGDTNKMAQQIGGAIILGLTDAKSVETLIEKNMGMAGKIITKAGPRHYTIKVPEWRTVTVKLSDTHLVASTDPAVVDRALAGDDSKSFVNTLKNPALKANLIRKNATGINYSLMGATAGWFFLSGFHDWSPPPEVIPENASSEYRKLATELASLRKTHREKKKAEEKLNQKSFLDILLNLGPFAGQLRTRKEGIYVEYGLYPHAPTVQDAELKIATLIRDLTRRKKVQSKRRNAFWEQERALREQLMKLGTQAK